MLQIIFCALFSVSLYAMNTHQSSHGKLTVNVSVTNPSDNQTKAIVHIYEGRNFSTTALQPRMPNSNLQFNFNSSTNMNSSSMSSSNIRPTWQSNLNAGSSFNNTYSHYQPPASQQSSWHVSTNVKYTDSQRFNERMQQAKNDFRYEKIMANPESAAKFDQKMNTLKKEAKEATDLFEQCAESYQAGDKACVRSILKIFDLVIHEPGMNAILQEKKEKLMQYIITPESSLRRTTCEESGKVMAIATELKTELNAYLKWEHSTIALEHEKPHSDKYYKNTVSNSSLARRVSENNFNKDLNEIDDLCSQNKFDQAKPLAEKYLIKGQASAVSDEARNNDQMVRDLYRSYLAEKYDSYGIRREYRQDPLYKEKTASLKRSPLSVPNKELNDLFGERYEKMMAIANKLPQESSKKIVVQRLAYTLAELHERDPMSVIDYLANNVASDHNLKNIQEASQLFYGKDGLPSIYTFDEIVTDLVRAISPDINTITHAQERELLGKLALLHMEYPNEEAYLNGITYVVQASNCHPCAAEYLTYAQALVEAGIKVDQAMKADFLECGSFYTPQVREVDSQLHKEVVTMASTLAQSVGKNEMVEGENPTYVLKNLHDTYTDYFNNPRPSAQSRLKMLISHYDRHLTKQLPMQINIPSTRAIHTSSYPPQSALPAMSNKQMMQETIGIVPLSSLEQCQEFIEGSRGVLQQPHEAYNYVDAQNNSWINDIDARQNTIARMPASYFERASNVSPAEVKKKLPLSIKTISPPVDTAMGVVHGLDFLFRGYNYLRLTHDPLLMPVQYLYPPLYEWSYHAKLMTDDALLSFYNAQRIEKLKKGVCILTDLAALPPTHTDFNIALSGLHKPIIKLPRANKTQALAGIEKSSEEIAVLETMAENESEVVRTFGKKLKPAKNNPSHIFSNGFYNHAHEMLEEPYFITRGVLYPTSDMRPFNEQFGNHIVHNKINEKDLSIQKSYAQAEAILTKNNQWQTLKEENSSAITDGSYYHPRSVDKKALFAQYPYFEQRPHTPIRTELRKTILPIAVSLNERIRANSPSRNYHIKTLDKLYGVYEKALNNNRKAQQILRQFAQEYNENRSVSALDKTTRLDISDVASILADNLFDLQKKLDRQIDFTISSLQQDENTIRQLPELSEPLRYSLVGTIELLNRIAHTSKGIVHPVESAKALVDATAQLVQVTARLIQFTSMATAYEDGWSFQNLPQQVDIIQNDFQNDFRFVATAIDHFAQTPNIEKFKMAVGAVTDVALQHTLFKTVGMAKKALMQSLQEVQQAELLTPLPKPAMAIDGLQPVMQKEIAVLGQMEEALAPKIPALGKQPIVQEAFSAESIGKVAQAETKVPVITEQVVQAAEELSAVIKMAEAERLTYLQKVESTLKINGELTELVTFLKNGKTIKEFTFSWKQIKKYWEHIFSGEHLDAGVMALGNTKSEIIENVISSIISADEAGVLKIGDNTFCTVMNEHKAVLRCRIDEGGKVLSINCYGVSDYASTKMTGNVINMWEI